MPTTSGKLYDARGMMTEEGADISCALEVLLIDWFDAFSATHDLAQLRKMAHAAVECVADQAVARIE